MGRKYTLADGQLAASSTTILAGSSLDGDGDTIDISCTNTASTTETVILTLSRAGGTARRIARAKLSQNQELLVTGVRMQPDDTLAGYTTNASAVDYLVFGSSSSQFGKNTYDANGSLKSGAASVSGDLTLTGDLTLQNSAGTSDLVWDASAVDPLWANVPSRLQPNFHQIAYEIYDDFVYPASATASDVMAWVAMNDGSTGTPAFLDTDVGGYYTLVTAGAQDDYSGIRCFNKAFKFASGKKFWCEMAFKLTEAATSNSAWWFGITSDVTTGGIQAGTAGPLATYDGALIWKDEATLTIDFETSNAGTQATTTAMATFVSGNYTRVGFYFDGTATTSVITPYYSVDGTSALVAGTAQNITLAGLDAFMYLLFGVKAGPTAGAETLSVDYVRAIQLR